MTRLPPHREVDRFTPGKTFIPTITPEQTQVVINTLKTQPSGCTTKALGLALGLSATAASPLLKQLCDEGLLRQTVTCNIRIYQLVESLTNHHLVRLDKAGEIMAFLSGRREMIPAIARTCHLTPAETFATCQQLAEQRQLHTVTVGAAFIYFLPPTTIQRGPAKSGSTESARVTQ